MKAFYTCQPRENATIPKQFTIFTEDILPLYKASMDDDPTFTLPYQHISIIIASLLFSGLLAGLEAAFLASDKLILKLEEEKGALKGRAIAFFLKEPSRVIGTTLVGNTLALVLYSAHLTTLLEPLITQHLSPSVHNNILLLVLETCIATLGILVVGEFIPKSIFLRNPNRLLLLFALPLTLIIYVLYPLVSLTTWLAKLTLQYLFKSPYAESTPVFGLTDFHNFVKKTSQTAIPNPIGARAKIASNVLGFKKVRARDCMVPRTEIVAVQIQAGIQTLQNIFIETGHSKVLVYRNDIDDIIGYCHSKDLFKKPSQIESILTPIIIVPETSFAQDVMRRFISEQKSVALVVDEFGGTAGIVTMEDIIEQIFGDIQDEYDTEDLLEQQESNDTYLLSARLEIDYLNEKYGWQIPSGDYDTIGGLVTSITGTIPEPGEEVYLPPFRFKVLSIQDTCVGTVRLTIQPHAQD